MPRKNPLPETELEICARLLKFRRSLGLSRVVFSRRAEIDSSTIANYEHRRAPIRMTDAWRLLRVFNLGAKWLATGQGPQNGSGANADFETVASGHSERALFSAVFREFYNSAEERLLDEAKSVWFESSGCFETLISLRRAGHLFSASPEVLRESSDGLIDAWAALASDEKLLAASREIQKQAKKLTDYIASNTCKVVHTDTSRWLALKARLVLAVSKRGERSALAKLLKVSPQAVSEWLAGDSAPNAENTLRLLEWVKAAEAKQTKTPAVLVAQPGRKTRSAKSTSNEKVQSDQPKR